MDCGGERWNVEESGVVWGARIRWSVGARHESKVDPWMDCDSRMALQILIKKNNSLSELYFRVYKTRTSTYLFNVYTVVKIYVPRRVSIQ